MAGSVSDLLKLARNVDRLFSLEERYGKAIEKIEIDLSKLADRVTHLESREEMMIVEARAAAGVAASQVAIASISDVSRRIGRLEERSALPRLEAPE